jgi:cytochrome c
MTVNTPLSNLEKIAVFSAKCVRIASVAALLLSGCEPDRGPPAPRIAGGDPAKGRAAVERYGCPACHTIAGIEGANGLVGPPLTGVANRVYIAGVLTNTPENLIRWITNPPAVDPLTAMPYLNVSDADARDIASFLYTLR